jgi:hypothetical protein
MRPSSINKTKKKRLQQKKIREEVNSSKEPSKNMEIEIITSPKDKLKPNNICKIEFSPIKDRLRQTNTDSNFKFSPMKERLHLAKTDSASKFATKEVMKIEESFDLPCEEEKTSLELWEMLVSSSNNMVFGIFPPNMIKELISDDIGADERWRLIEVATSFLKSGKKLSEKLQSGVSFSKFIFALLEKTEEECLPPLLRLLRTVLEGGWISGEDSLEEVFRGVVKYLGGKEVGVRQEAMRVSISVMKRLDKKKFFKVATQFLNSNNWRIREEVLNLMIISMLDSMEGDFDYLEIIKAISKLVNDDNPKVRFVARESLAIMTNKGDRDVVLDLWGQLVVHNEYLKLNERLLNRTIMTFNEKNLMFEYPKQSVQQRTLEKSKIKIRSSPEQLQRNRIFKHHFSLQKSNAEDLNPQGDDQLVDYLTKTIERDRKETMISFDKSEYTEADTTFAKTKNMNHPRKIKLKGIVKGISPQKLTNRSYFQSEVANARLNKWVCV